MLNHITLTNQALTVTISPKGAELQSIFSKEHGLEYMWNANPDFWSKKSPVLFPIVGGLKENTYTYLGKEYHLNRHGFARDMMFQIGDVSETSVTFFITSTTETQELYPFSFVFFITYTINQNTLSITYSIENKGQTEMYCSVGAHPAFKIPLTENTSFNDYYLALNTTETTGIWPLSSDGLIELHPLPFLENTNRIPLTKELFYKDALVFKDLKSNALSILNNVNKHGLTVAYNGFPYMGIWSSKDADFVCIEPWCGIADSTNTTGILQNKEGINCLMPSEVFNRTFTVTVF